MVITYHGLEFFKITQGSLTVAFNPISKQSKHKQTRFGADLCLITTNDPDLNGSDSVTLGDKVPFVINGPGEYESNELFIRGFLSKTTYNGVERFNTIYSLRIDDINICFLGALGETELSAEAKTAFEDIDILFVPIGGDGVLSASEAYSFAIKREPRLIIPMHYGAAGDKDALKTFLKEGGAEGKKAVDKLTLKKKDLVGGATEIVVLES